MVTETVKQFNWIDIFIILLLIRVYIIALKTGLPAELFKLSGTIAAIYIGMHYYTNVGNFMVQRLNMQNIPLEITDFVAFVVLISLTYGFFALMREFFSRFIKLEAVPQLNKWGGLALGFIRGIFLASLVCYMFTISSIEYFKKSVNVSYLGKSYFNQVAPSTYSWLWDNIMSKLSSGETFNKTVLEVQGK